MRRTRTATGPGRPARIALTILILVAAGSGAARAEDDPKPRPADPSTLETVRFLLRNLTAERGASPEQVYARLTGLGPRAVPALLATTKEFRTRDHIEVAVAALRKLEPAAVDDYTLSLVAGTEEGDGRATAYLQMGEYATAAAVPKLIALMPENHPRTKRQAEVALVKLLRRHDDPGLYVAVDQSLAKASDETRGRVLCSVGDTDSEHGMRMLLDALGRWPKMDHTILAAIGQMPGSGAAEEIVPRLKPYLESEDFDTRRETVTALGVFRDVESVKLLVDLLGDDESGIRGNAHWALKSISGLDFPQDRTRWKLWYDEEVTWWEKEGRYFLELFEEGTAEEILVAIRELSKRGLFRDKLMGPLKALLDHPDQAVRAAAHAALVSLGLEGNVRGKDAAAAFAARGFYPVREGLPGGAADETPAPEETNSSSRSLAPLLGLIVILVLYFRIFGLATLDQLKRVLRKSRGQQDGPVTMTLRPREDRPLRK